MQRTKLKDRILPIYTKGEEIFNMTSHIAGGGVGVVALVLCVVFAALRGNIYGVVSGAIYGATMIILYTMSSIYHGLRPHLTAKKVFQVIDHCSIFLLIAGTYTPISLCSLREYSPLLGWSIYGIIWALAALGIVLNSIDLKKYNIFSMICYLGMGWCIIVAAKPAWQAVGTFGMNMILAGGILYTIGAIFYGFGSKKKYIHSVFHIFVVLASIVHFLAILIFVM